MTSQEVHRKANKLSRHQWSNKNRPRRCADLAGCGGKTEWDVPKVGCSNLISNGSFGISTDCRLEPNEGVAL